MKDFKHVGGGLWGPMVSYKGGRDTVYGETVNPNPHAIFDRDGPLNRAHDYRRENFLREERGSQTSEEFQEAVHGEVDRYGSPRIGFHVEDIFQGLKDQGYRIAVVTNQPDILKHNREQDRQATREMNEYLIELGADIVVACSHPAPNWESAYAADEAEVEDRWPDDRSNWRCDCHKPETGMFRFLDEFADLDYSSSFMVGDSPSDLEAAVEHADNAVDALYFVEEYPLDQKPVPDTADRSFDSTEELIASWE